MQLVYKSLKHYYVFKYNKHAKNAYVLNGNVLSFVFVPLCDYI